MGPVIEQRRVLENLLTSIADQKVYKEINISIDTMADSMTTGNYLATFLHEKRIRSLQRATLQQYLKPENNRFMAVSDRETSLKTKNTTYIDKVPLDAIDIVDLDT